MKLHFLNGVRKGESLELTLQGVSLGRETDNDIALLVEGVSRYHSKIENNNNKWILRDLGSTNGTEINREAVNVSQVLEEGDIIDIGDQKLRFGEEKIINSISNNIPNGSSNEPPRQTSVNISEQSEDDIVSTPIDELNLFKSKETSKSQGFDKDVFKKRLLNVLFYGGILFIAFIFIILFLANENSKKVAKNQKNIEKKEEKKSSFVLFYEREEASVDNIFYVTLQVEGTSAYLTLDDLSSKRKYSKRAINIPQKFINDLEKSIRETDFYNLEEKHSSLNSGDKSSKKTIFIASQNELKRIIIKDEIAPSAFINVESIIRDFTSDSLNIDTFMTAEETKAEGINAFYKAQSLYKNYDADPTNLKEAIKRYQKAEDLLSQFPYESKELVAARQNKLEANKIRENKLSGLTFSYSQAIRMENIDDAISCCYQIMSLTDTYEKKYINAKKKVIKLETILRKRSK